MNKTDMEKRKKILQEMAAERQKVDSLVGDNIRMKMKEIGNLQTLEERDKAMAALINSFDKDVEFYAKEILQETPEFQKRIQEMRLEQKK